MFSFYNNIKSTCIQLTEFSKILITVKPYRGEIKGTDPRLKFLAWPGRGSETTEWGVGVGGGYPPGHGVETLEK